MSHWWLLLVFAPLSAAAVTEPPTQPMLVLDSGGHTSEVARVLFTPDGRELISVSKDRTIRVWDVVSGEPLRVLRPPIGTGLEGKLHAAALSPDGQTLAVGGTGWGGDNHPVYLISLAPGRIERVLKGHSDVIISLAFSPDGKRLASGSTDNTARIWDTATGACEKVLKGHDSGVFGVAFSPDGRRLATASFDTTGRIWNVATGKVERILQGHQEGVHCLAWSPDGQTVATGSKDQSIRLWGANGAPYRQFDNLGDQIFAVAFSPDSRRLLYTWGGKVPGAGILDLATGKEVVRFSQHNRTVMAGAFSPDGALAATGDYAGDIYLWKAANASVLFRLTGKGRSLYSAAWGPDGRSVAWGCRAEGNSFKADAPLERSFRLSALEFGDAPDQTFRRAQPARGSVALESPGPHRVAVNRGSQTVTDLKVFDNYNRAHCFTLLSEDLAAVGAEFGRLYLFGTRTGKVVRHLRGHTSAVLAVAPSPDNRYLLSASADQTLRVWDPDREEPLLSLFFADDNWIAWTPEGYYATSPGGEKLMGWQVNNGSDRMASFSPAARFRKSLYRPDVIKLLLTTGSVDRALEAADKARGKQSKHTEVADVLPPQVAITSPAQSGVRVGQAELEVQASAASVGAYPVTALRLLLDGRPYQDPSAVRVFSPPKLGIVQASWRVQLAPGKHQLVARAESEVSSGDSAPVEVVCEGKRGLDVLPDQSPAAEVQLPSLYVLAVGISAYPGDLKLQYAARDAETITQVCREKARPLYRKVDVKLLTDGQATRRDFLQGLTWLHQQMTQRDVAVVSFAGHGANDADGTLYLLPVDADPKDLLSSAVPGDQLKKVLANTPGKIVVLLDACHAGAVDAERRRAATSLTDDLVRDLVTDDYGVIVMCSAMGREFALESSEVRHGFFTEAVVEGLSGKADYNHDGVVHFNELDLYVTDRVKELAQGRQHPVISKPSSIRSFPLTKP